MPAWLLSTRQAFTARDFHCAEWIAALESEPSMAATLSMPRGLFWFLPVRRRTATLCPECAVCGRERDSSPELLLKQGHRRAAVWAARTEFEQRLVAVINAICTGCGVSQPKTRQKDVALKWLASHGCLTHSQALRFAKVYKRASEMVHGEPMTKFTAAGVLREMLCMIETLAAIDPTTVVKELDYEREQLIEQFGDAMLSLPVEGGAA